MAASVGSPPSIRCADAGACVTPSAHRRQAYFGRMVTMTRNCAGIDEDQQTLRGSVCPRRVQPLRAVFSAPVHLAAAAGTKQAVRLDHLFDAEQARRKMPAVAACGPAQRRPGQSLRLLLRLNLGDSRFEILEGQLALVVVQLFGALAMHDLVQLGDEMLQPPVGFPQRIPLAQHLQHSCTLAFGDCGKIDGRSFGHAVNIA
jgi:hypothetical protein